MVHLRSRTRWSYQDLPTMLNLSITLESIECSLRDAQGVSGGEQGPQAPSVPSRQYSALWVL